MSILQVICLTIYAAGMALGQTFFKLAADQISAVEVNTFSQGVARIWKIAVEPNFVFAIALYMSLSAFWVWILSFTPLTRAYPFGALAFVFTIIIGALFFREPITRMHLLGLAFILSGIALIARA